MIEQRYKLQMRQQLIARGMGDLGATGQRQPRMRFALVQQHRPRAVDLDRAFEQAQDTVKVRGIYGDAGPRHAWIRVCRSSARDRCCTAELNTSAPVGCCLLAVSGHVRWKAVVLGWPMAAVSVAEAAPIPALERTEGVIPRRLKFLSDNLMLREAGGAITWTAKAPRLLKIGRSTVRSRPWPPG